MTAPPSSPFEKLCELAHELIRKRGEVDIDVLLVLSDSARQLGLPKESVQAAIDSLSEKKEPVDAAGLTNDPDAIPTAIPIADGIALPPPPAGSRWTDLPEALPLSSGPPPRHSPLIATPVELPASAPAQPQPRSHPSTLPKVKPPTKSKPKPKPKPAVRYRRWLKQRLAPRANQSISARELQSLLDFGVQQAGLSHFYADDILAETCHAHSIELPSPQPKTNDPTLLEYVDYCKEVLAIEGGVNVQSRLKMDAKADELKLTEQQREQSLGLLETKVQPNRLQRRTDAFETFLSESLAGGSKVSPDGYQQLEQKADELFGLTSDLAARSITKIAKQKSVQVITKETAAELLDRSIAAVIDDQTTLDTDSKDKLLAEGQRIGIQRDQVLQRIDSTLQANRDQYRIQKQKDHLLLLMFGFVITCVVIAVGTGAYFIASKETPPPVVESQPQESPSRSPDWWTTELTLAAAELKQILPEATADLKALESKIAVARIDACQHLIDRFVQLSESLDQRVRDMQGTLSTAATNGSQAAVTRSEIDALELLQQVLVQTYIVEQDQRVHELWRRGLLGPLSSTNTVAWRDQSFGLLFRRLLMAEEVLKAEQLDTEPRNQLTEFLNESIPEDPTATESADAFRRRLTIYLHDQMKGISSDVQLDQMNYRVLLLNAQTTMSAEETKAFGEDLVFQIVPTLVQSLGGFEQEVRRLMAPADGILLSRFVDIYERMQPGDAQRTMANLLLAAAGLSDQPGRSTQATALAIRERLLETPSAANSAGSNQLEPWLRRTELVIRQPLAADDNAVALLTQSATLAQHLAIGEAIVEAEKNAASNAPSVLQDLNNLGEFAVPATPTRSTITGRTRISSLSSLYQDRFYKYLDQLRTARNARTRVSTLNIVFSASTYVDDITPELAARLVDYTLTLKPNEEHLLIVQNIGKWMRWRYFQLSLADAVAGITIPPARAKALLDPLLGRDIDTSKKNWKTALRLELLQSARDRFGNTTTTSSEDRSIDAAADYLTEVLSLKSRLRGHVPDPQQNAMPTPARALTAATLAFGQRMSASSPSVDVMPLVNGANRRRELANHVAHNDMGQTAALQRAYLHLLAADLVSLHPEILEKANQLLNELDTRDRNAKSLLVQIRDAEWIGIKLLTLHGATP